MKKKIISLFVILCMLTSLCAVSASAACRGTSNSGYQVQQTDFYSILARLQSLCGKSRDFGCFGQQADTQQPVEQPEQPTEQPEQPTEQPEQPVEQPEQPTEQPTQPADTSYAGQVLALVNDYRAENGLEPLTLNSSLSAVAQKKAQDMKDNNYFAHESPTYGSPFSMMQSAGIAYRSAGENIAMGYSSPAAVVEAWMNSAGHRANILNSSYTQMGLGYVASGNYWSQMFIG